MHMITSHNFCTAFALLDGWYSIIFDEKNFYIFFWYPSNEINEYADLDDDSSLGVQT